MLEDESWRAQHGEPPTPDAPEVERIRTHLELVERRLRTAESSGLDEQQRRNRAAALDALRDCRRAGVFPRRSSDAYAGRRPPFIDDRGVHCAVGEMIRATGEPELAAALNRQYEYAFIPEIVDASLNAWADAFGFSSGELAMIQPRYGPPPPTRASTRELRSLLRRPIVSTADDVVVSCAAEHEPVSSVVLRVWPTRRALRVWSLRRDPFVKCFVEQIRQSIPVNWWSTSWIQMRVEVRPLRELLAEQLERIDYAPDQTSCAATSGPRPIMATVDVRLDEHGRHVHVETQPPNPEVATCLTRVVDRRLWKFGGSAQPVARRWSGRL